MRHVVAIAVVVLALVAAAEAAPPSNVGYRKLEIHDTVTGELYPVALWYPTLAAPAPLFLTASLSPCGLPAILCRLMAFEMPVAADAAPAGGAFGLVVISHGGGGMALNHRDLALALAARGYVAAAPAHPRGGRPGRGDSGRWRCSGRGDRAARAECAALHRRGARQGRGAGSPLRGGARRSHARAVSRRAPCQDAAARPGVRRHARRGAFLIRRPLPGTAEADRRRGGAGSRRLRSRRPARGDEPGDRRLLRPKAAGRPVASSRPTSAPAPAGGCGSRRRPRR